MNKKYIEKYGVLVVFLLAALLLLTPLFFRADVGAPITPRAESYTLLLQETITPMTGLLNIFSFFTISWTLPLLLMMIFLTLFTKYIQQYYAINTSVFILLAFILSPSMSVLGTTLNTIVLALIFILLALLLPRLSFVFITLTLITHPLIGLLAILYFCSTFKHLRQFLGILLSITAASAWYALLATPPLLELSFAPSLFELGTGGISIFFIVFAVHGMFSVPKKRKMILFTSCMLAFSLFSPALAHITVLFLSVLIGHSIVSLLTTKWKLDLLQQILLVLVFCLGLFLAIISIQERITDNPTHEFYNTMKVLGEQTRSGNILTVETYAPLVEYFSGRKPVVNTTIFYSRNPQEVYDFLERTDTSYVLITAEMVDTMFDRSDQGILFVLPNAQHFVRIHASKKSTMWYYIPRNS